jgi:hypothetical protein
MKNKICFVIALKYYRTYPVYIREYVDNIRKYYDDSFIIIVDNNSEHIGDITFDYDNVVIITNTSDQKFELGAYNLGIRYIIDNGLTEKYDYYTFTQETFMLCKKFDVDELANNGVKACPLVCSKPGSFTREFISDFVFGVKETLIIDIIAELGLTHKISELTFCFANSFILHKSKLYRFNQLTSHIIILNKIHSQCCERFLSGIFYILNEGVNTALEDRLVNDFYNSIGPGNIIKLTYFTKYLYARNETTTEKKPVFEKMKLVFFEY